MANLVSDLQVCEEFQQPLVYKELPSRSYDFHSLCQACHVQPSFMFELSARLVFKAARNHRAEFLN